MKQPPLLRKKSKQFFSNPRPAKMCQENSQSQNEVNQLLKKA